jgi:hypothetical protein
MKIGKYGVMAGIMLIGLLAALSGCNLGGEEPDYGIEFTVNDTDYVFTQAHDDPADVAEGCMVTSPTIRTRMIADSASDNTKYVYMTFSGTDTGTYHDLEMQLFFEYVDPAGNNLLDESATADDFDLTVTEYGPVGGVIRGTFSGQVKESGTANVYALTAGAFCVKRKADGSISLE